MAEPNSTLLLEVALDLANSITNSDRFDRLLSSIRKAINCDAVVLLAFQGKLLQPLAIQGLTADTLGRRFWLKDHPRLALICESTDPVRFSSDTELPDPYDGLLLAQAGDLPVHSCMGLPLYSDGQMMGVVTLDSLKPDAFSAISERTLQLISAMSAATLKTAIQLKKLEQSARQAQDLVEELTHEALTRDGGELIGESQSMLALKSDIQLVASSDYTVLIQGQTGVGKELVARTVHQQSRRAKQQLVHLNCASLPETLADSELFGHAKGAFTGAERERPGKFLLADGGTIFLDEVGELPLSVQSKLLRVLQSGEIQPVGKDEVKTVNVRVIAATNRDLSAEVTAGNFRADLYHRLSVYPIVVPPLKERHQDIVLLAGYFLEVTARKLGIRQLKLSVAAQSQLLLYPWPGNVRELEHVISRAALKARKEANAQDIIALLPTHLDLTLSSITELNITRPSNASEHRSLKTATEEFQKQQIVQALQNTSGNWSLAAKLLDLDRANLSRLAKRIGIKIEKSITS
ncbi:MAG: nitric oxide reductase transcriptional regulator NorR [Gammaproteobacteria bacterium]|nr:nitric oxide reductase transcriptional regulator NorR [Gammaproteobacteria bacterium]MBU1555939.1 nitric oxide reductase transcriptional regulator NorR [Gammaproteobacteria bacterium]